jgi:predicted house-cleaning NTP pyrophosphatase (Maf/HAM1 superfamily)
MQKNMNDIQEIVKKASKSSLQLQCVKIVSLKMDSDSPLKTDPDGQEKIQKAGIYGVKDVGKWIVKSVEEDLKEAKTAHMLERYLSHLNCSDLPKK